MSPVRKCPPPARVLFPTYWAPEPVWEFADRHGDVRELSKAANQ